MHALALTLGEGWGQSDRATLAKLAHRVKGDETIVNVGGPQSRSPEINNKGAHLVAGDESVVNAGGRK